MLDPLLNVLLDIVYGALGILPHSTISFPDSSLWLNPLEEINYLLPVDLVFALVLGALLLFPIFLGTTMALWAYALVRGGGNRA